MAISARWCECSHGDGSSHLAGSWCERSSTVGGGAVPVPAVSTPHPALVASSHRTVRTHDCEVDGWCQYVHPATVPSRLVALADILGRASRR